jgi:uncharacterized membrane protein
MTGDRFAVPVAWKVRTSAQKEKHAFLHVATNRGAPAVSQFLVAFLVALIAFGICDFAWLGFAAKDFYQAQIGPLLLEKPNLAAAAIFYPLYAAGIVFFCVEPALTQGSWLRALIFGMLLGLLAYGTYDLSNLATLKGWSLPLVVVDIVWGMAVSGIAATAGYFAARAVS